MGPIRTISRAAKNPGKIGKFVDFWPILTDLNQFRPFLTNSWSTLTDFWTIFDRFLTNFEQFLTAHFQKIQAAAYANASYQPVIFPQMTQMAQMPQMTAAGTMGQMPGMQFVQLM